MKNTLIIIVSIALLSGCCVWLFLRNGERTIITHSSVVEKIESIGKLELVKMTVQDIVEHQIERDWMLNAKAILIIQGEAAGCIDMQKIKKENISISDGSLSIKLPAPEIAYCKVNHEKSRIYDTANTFFSGATIVDEAYRDAEKQLEKTVLEIGILEQTKANAELFFKSFFQSLGFKNINIEFENLTNKKI
jgi:hypothetical protein